MSIVEQKSQNKMEDFTKARLASGSIPIASGVSLKPQHFEEILEALPEIAWFEVHPENYLVDGGPMLHYLSKIRASYPLSFHSVGMSLGSFGGVAERKNHLLKLKTLINRFEPGLVSDHLSWSSWQQMTFNDLLPMPYNMESLQVMCDNIDMAQTILGRQIAIENPSSYFNLKSSETLQIDLEEAEFLVQLAQKSGAKILLDINNIYVSAQNHGWNAKNYIKKIPSELVSEIHLAGHAKQEFENGEILIDDHGSNVCAEVWRLYSFALAWLGGKPSLIEWDTNIPEWQILKQEADKANDLLLTYMDFDLTRKKKKEVI